MSHQDIKQSTDSTKDRREFLKHAGTAAVAAPAAALMLSASVKRVSADTAPDLSGQALQDVVKEDDVPTICWVAREVYGVENPRWLDFRAWMLTQAPAWFRRLYIRHGESLAAWLSDKPVLKGVIRTWMDRRIAA